jgi:hypothetical protein
MINMSPHNWGAKKDRISEGDSAWLLFSVGPDGFAGQRDGKTYGAWNYNDNLKLTLWRTYDPTNGTISPGNIFGGQWGIEKAGITVEEKSHIDIIGY